MSEATLTAGAAVAMKVAYPAIVVAWKSVGTSLAATPEDQRRAQDWQSVGDLLAFIDGHGDHGGWKFNGETQAMTCECGDLMYEVGDPLPAGGGSRG